MRRSIIAICLLALPLVNCAAEQRRSLEKAQSVVTALITDLESNRVVGVEVFYIPTRIRFFAAVTPAGLKTEYHYRVSVQQTGVTAMSSGLLGALRQTHLKIAESSSDMRWGLVFNLAQGVRREICMDRSGRAGIIEDTPVELGEALSAWLKHLTSTFP